MDPICAVCGGLNFEFQRRRSIEQSPATEPPSDLAPWQASVKNSVDIVRTTRAQKRFEQSAGSGCMRCRMVCEGFKGHLYHEYMVHLELGPGIIHLRPETHSDNLYRIRSLQFYVLPGSPSPWPGFPELEDLSRKGLPEAAIEFVSSQLRFCQRWHDQCKLEQTYNPTRLLDIGDVRSTMVNLVDGTLCEKDGSLPGQVQYAALSYCWGQDCSAQATTASVASLRMGITDSELPRTVRDAAQFTRRLGLRYLWVDRVCILQDSLEDWENESSQMASVYRHALVTLAASTASCASQGFSEVAVDSWKSGWWQYRMKSVVEVPFERAGGSESDGAVMIRVRNSPEHVDHESRVPSLDTLPLNRRGWALQESILSTRVVAFEDSELTWRCNSGTTCECKAVDFPTPTMQRRSIQSLGSKTEVYQFWRYCVARYSWCRLTDLSDKFPAISGIASAVYQLTGSQFVAGIWSDDLAKCLAWTRNYAGDRHLFPSFPQPRETPTMTAPTSNVYHAPTFSWASIDGNGVVSYEVMDSLTSQWKDAECVLVDHEVRLKGQNRFGAVSGGSITIRGMTLPAEAIFASMTLGDYQPFIRSERLTQCMHADLDEPCGVFKLDKNDPDANEFGPLPARQETWSQFCCEQSSQGTYGKPIEKSPARRQYLEAFWEGTERK